MVKFISFSSGSCGNCYFLGTEDEGILIDAGVSPRRVKTALQDYGMNLDSFGAILVTHDHLDHIRHLGSFCKRFKKPVYATSVLHRSLAAHSFTSQYIGGCRKYLNDDGWTQMGSFSVRQFIVPHDATETVGYAICIKDLKFVIMTDIGRMTDEALSLASQADTVVIESNYDMDMLLGGSYTYELKMRIVQGHGHLSNDECAQAIKQFAHPGLKNIFLCHLSENNNTPKLAFDCSKAALDSIGSSVSLRCLPRRQPSPLFIL